MGALKAFINGPFYENFNSNFMGNIESYRKLNFFSFPIRHPLTFPNKEIDIEKE